MMQQRLETKLVYFSQVQVCKITYVWAYDKSISLLMRGKEPTQAPSYNQAPRHFLPTLSPFISTGTTSLACRFTRKAHTTFRCPHDTFDNKYVNHSLGGVLAMLELGKSDCSTARIYTVHIPIKIFARMCLYTQSKFRLLADVLSIVHTRPADTSNSPYAQRNGWYLSLHHH